MNKFKKLKKVLALVLVFCMVMGSIPATAFASTEKPIDAAIIFTDLHTNKSDYKASTINGIFSALKNSGLTFSSVTSGGDAFSVNEDSSGSNGPYTGYIKNINTSIKNALEKQDIPINYVWSDHDRYAVKEDGSTLLDKTSHLSYGAGKDGVYGTSDDGNYYVYSLSMGDICSYDRYKAGFSSNREKNGFTATIDKAIAGFEADVEKLDKTKPLLIVSHQPLYDNRNDNAFAEQWFDAINKVAEDMDVAFFYGHNHKYDKAEDYYYAKGSTMPVATKSGWSSYEVGVGYKPSCDLKAVNKTLNFTHMCAGYTEPTSTGSYDNNTTRKGTVMSVSVYEDRVEYNTYSKDGKYTGNYAVNTSVPRTHAPVEEPETPVVPEDTEINVDGVNVTVSGATVESSSKISEGDQALIDEKGYEEVIGVDIKATLNDENEKASLKFELPDSLKAKKDRLIGVSVEDGEVKEVKGKYENGYFTFEVDHFSAKAVAVQDNFPDFPNEGAVRINKKIVDSENFNSTGVAQIEVSASGIPVNKGIDIIVMLDMSSSMNRCIEENVSGCKDNNHTTRVKELSSAMKTFIKELNESSNADNIRVAVADFNGIYRDANSPYYLQNCDRGIGTNFNPESYAKVYTNTTNALDESAFVKATSLRATDFELGDFNPKQGTNYDYAFDAVYQLGNAIKKKNARDNVERELCVVFMSDGAPNQYNYYGSVGGNNRTNGTLYWDYWLNGKMGQYSESANKNINFADVLECEEHTYYYDSSNGNQHRMANAVKGDPNVKYEVIRKNDTGLEDELSAIAGKDNMYQINGLGATMYSIAFDPADDGAIPWESMVKILEEYIPTSKNHYFLAESTGALTAAFERIASEVKYAASSARIVDQMGSKCKLQIGEINDLNGNKVKDSSIEIVSYETYTEADALANSIPVGKKIGDRKNDTPTVLETVTFNALGTEAYSDKVNDGNTNILIDGIINAKYFIYNTLSTEVDIEGVDIPTVHTAEENASEAITSGSTSILPAETFYWKLGTIQTRELAMRYYVYLEGSMEGKREAGVYQTNEFANIYYKNYLDVPVVKLTTSPTVSWGDAKVTYAYYLVDENGNPIVSEENATTGEFKDKIVVVNPSEATTVYWNSSKTIDASAYTLPEGYSLYDNESTYTVKIKSDDTGNWKIEKSKDKSTTYVTWNNNNEDCSNELEYDDNAVDYKNTVVWFAVTCNIKAKPDTVVIDYGLPVDISVLANDNFNGKGSVAGVGSAESVKTSGFTSTLDDTKFKNSYNAKYGKSVVNTESNKVTYTLDSMVMDEHDTLAYAVEYKGAVDSAYYYNTVTVIPATTIYYEDSFVDFKVYSNNNELLYKKDDTGNIVKDNEGNPIPMDWNTVGNTIENAVQAEDRPGVLNGEYDANNVYGYDKTYEECSLYSLGSSKKIEVTSDIRGEATFDFIGTGFDIVGLTSSTTGALIVQVMDNNGNVVRSAIVDTYYGYACEDIDKDGKKEWYPVSSNDPNALYQVPVIEISGLDYGKYTAKLIAGYNKFFDHMADSQDKNGKDEYSSYELYIDAVRIYDPCKSEDEIANDAYLADNEAYPEYFEIRDKIIEADEFSSMDDEANGIVFIDDANNGNVSIADYTDFGPNNELYLQSDNAIAFKLSATAAEDSQVTSVQLGIKSVGGESSVKVYGVDDYGNKTEAVNETIKTATDMYYDITPLNGKTVVIKNTGNGNDAIISLTNIKTTYSEKQTSNTASVFTISRATANIALASMEEIPKVVSVETDKHEYVVGETVDVTVKTNNTAEYVMINDAKITDYEEVKGERIWKTSKKSSGLGDMNLKVVAYDRFNRASENLEKTISIVKFVPKTFVVKLDKKTAVLKDRVKATVITSDDVEYVTINGYKVTKYTYNKVNKTKTWSATFNMNTLGERTLKAVAYDKYGNAADSVSKTVTVKEFAPKTFKLALSKTTAVVKDKVKATVTTSDDVKYVTINGYKTTKYTYNKTNKTKTWTMEFKLNTLGKRTIKAVAYNTNGSASDAVSKSVTVNNFAPKTFKVTLDKSKVKKGAKYTVTVTTSSTVKYVTVNGKKVTKNTYSSKTGLRTFKVTCTAENTGKRTVKVYAFNTNGAKSALKTNALTVTKK